MTTHNYIFTLMALSLAMKRDSLSSSAAVATMLANRLELYETPFMTAFVKHQFSTGRKGLHLRLRKAIWKLLEYTMFSGLHPIGLINSR